MHTYLSHLVNTVVEQCEDVWKGGLGDRGGRGMQISTITTSYKGDN